MHGWLSTVKLSGHISLSPSVHRSRENQFGSMCTQLQRTRQRNSSFEVRPKNRRCFSFSFQTKCELFGKKQTPGRHCIGSDIMGENGTESFSMLNDGVVEESTEGIFSNRSTVRPSQPGLGQLFTGASWYSFNPCHYILSTYLGINLSFLDL